MATVVYFSKTGENLIDGKMKMITQGNTKILAEKIAEKLGDSSYAIEPLYPYPSDYSETVEIAKNEKMQQKRPDIKELPSEIEKDSVLFLGFPNWWGSYPMVVASFLESIPLKGKIIYPFCTHEGSGLGNSLEDLKTYFPEATIKKGLPVRGSRVSKSDEAIKNWLNCYFCHNK